MLAPNYCRFYVVVVLIARIYVVAVSVVVLMLVKAVTMLERKAIFKSRIRQKSDVGEAQPGTVLLNRQSSACQKGNGGCNKGSQ